MHWVCGSHPGAGSARIRPQQPAQLLHGSAPALLRTTCPTSVPVELRLGHLSITGAGVEPCMVAAGANCVSCLALHGQRHEDRCCLSHRGWWWGGPTDTSAFLWLSFSCSYAQSSKKEHSVWPEVSWAFCQDGSCSAERVRPWGAAPVLLPLW